MNRRRKGKTEQRELRKGRTLGNKGGKRSGEKQSWTNELNGGTISQERRIGNQRAKRGKSNWCSRRLRRRRSKRGIGGLEGEMALRNWGTSATRQSRRGTMTQG